MMKKLMTLNEWLDGENFFEVWHDRHQPEYLEVIGTNNLHLKFVLAYGQRYIPTTLNDQTIEDIVDVFHATYHDLFKHNMNSLIELELGTDYVITTDVEREGSTERSSKNEQIDKHSAFNVPENTVIGGNDNISTDDVSELGNSQMVQKKVSFEKIGEMLSFTRKNLLVDTICIELSNVVTLSVY